MRIGIAHYSGASDISGVTSWLSEFCGRLAGTGHRIGVHLHHFGIDPSEGSILKHLRRFDIEVFPAVRKGSLEADARQTLQFLDEFQPDLFLPHCLHAHYCAAAHAGRQGLPWALTIHSDDPDYWCVADALNPIRTGGSTVCVSRYLAEKAATHFGIADPRVIPYGVTSPKDFSVFQCEPFRVVYSGRMVTRQKCIYQVIRALIMACQRSPHIQADLLGDGPELAACKNMVIRAGLGDRIRFMGRLDPAEVAAVLKQYQAILLMSDFEGLPVALMEAMAAGVVPVVRAIQSGIPELVYHEQTGLLVGNDPQEAATALVRLAEDQALWHRCSVAARSLVNTHYSAEQSFTLWTQFIDGLHGAARVEYPIPAAQFVNCIPLADARFLVQYPPTSLLRRLHPRRVARRVRASIHAGLIGVRRAAAGVAEKLTRARRGAGGPL